MIRKLILGAGLAGVAAVSCTSSRPSNEGSPASASASGSPASAAVAPASASSASSAYAPNVDPANFGSVVDNPFFPLPTGRTLTYEGVRDGAGQRDVFVITSETKDVMGVSCVVVRDTATRLEDGRLIERTDDWFAQDKEGNVWYMGEDTKLFDASGNVKSTEGSWTGGVDGALPGIVMPGELRIPSTSRQEFYVGHAQDTVWFIDTAQSVKVPYRSFDGVLETLEWSPLEPDVIEKKYYASGFGLIYSTSAAGEVETAKLVSVTGA
jgi:hypothetical protein